MILRELFDKVDDYEWVEKSPDRYVAKFTIGNEKFTWVAESMISEYGSWDIQFTIEVIRRGVVGQSAKKTGSNQEYRVFQTVISIMNDFLHSGELVNVLVFSADEPSRQRLYKHMVSRLLPTWDMSVDEEYGIFLVKRPGFDFPFDLSFK